MLRGLAYRLAWACAIPAALGACASTQEKIAQTAAVTAENDTFLPYREYKTSALLGGDSLNRSEGRSKKLLAARVDRKSGATAFILEYHIVYRDEGKRGYQSVRNAKAELLKMTSIKSRKSNCSRKTDACFVDEILQIYLPEQDVRQAGAGGYPVKLFARLGPHAQIDIPKVWIDSLLAKVDADKNAPIAAAAAPQPATQSAAAH